MHRAVLGVAVTGCVLAALPALAQGLASSLVEVREDGTLEVASDAFKANQPIPLRHSAYGQGVSPPLSWSKGPGGTRSYALILEDPDAPMAEPFVHWIMYAIPSDTRSLPEGIPGAARLEVPKGAIQGQNSRGSTGYFGPRPPAGSAHHYHFELFALDAMPELEPGADRQALLDAISDHVLAKGDLVGLFQKP